MNTTTTDLLEVWATEADVAAARVAVDAEISAAELADRISKFAVY